MDAKALTPVRLILYYLSQHKLSYSAGILFIVCTNWIAVSIPQYIQWSINLLTEEVQQHQDQLFHYFLIMLFLSLSMVIVRTLSRILFFNPGRAIEHQLKNDLFIKLTGLQKNYFDLNATGAIISRINNDINGVRLICGFGIMQVFNIATSLSLTPWRMWQLSPSLTLYCVIPIILVFTIVRFGMKIMVRHMHKHMENHQKLSGFTVASLSGIDVIKSYSMRAWNQTSFDRINQDILHNSMTISWVRSFLIPMLSNLENILKVLILSIGGLMVLQENFKIGELTAFIIYAGLLTMPLMGLGWVSTMIQQGMVSSTSLISIFQQATPFQETTSLSEASRKHLFQSGLKVSHLRFQYPGQQEAVLKDLSFEIKPGQTVGILGRIGSGKTTLVNCLTRYLQVASGQIFIGTHDINSLTYEDLRSCIRTVTQEPFLFSDSVEANIFFGLTEQAAQSADLEQLLQAAALTPEIQRFPQKKATVVGEKGIMLSGGQKQRISLARALACPCDLLILDNVLSAVDYDTERFLLEQILKKQQGRGLLIISHRATAFEQLDTILVLEDGMIADQGTHQELIQRPGFYQATWMLQHTGAG